jgi:hypothetical protein
MWPDERRRRRERRLIRPDRLAADAALVYVKSNPFSKEKPDGEDESGQVPKADADSRLSNGTSRSHGRDRMIRGGMRRCSVEGRATWTTTTTS